MTPPIELREPAEDELDFSSDSSIGSDSEVEIVGAMGPSIMSSPMKRKKWAVSKCWRSLSTHFIPCLSLIMA